jgi:predicted nucleic acid-binding protein
MRIVVDTNILFSFFKNDSLTKKLLEREDFKLISPSVALTEIIKYKRDILKKTGINENKFEKVFSELKERVCFIDEEYFKFTINEALVISPDKKDAFFLALCLKEDLVLWSNDKELKKQDRVLVLNTTEIMEFF